MPEYPRVLVRAKLRERNRNQTNEYMEVKKYGQGWGLPRDSRCHTAASLRSSEGKYEGMGK